MLFEPDKVLTCRHVVAANHGQGPIKTGITVRLPGLPPMEDVWPEQGEWLGVDAVVLTLPDPVGVAPVVLSGSLRAPAKVELVGYPQDDLTGEGVWRTFTVGRLDRPESDGDSVLPDLAVWEGFCVIYGNPAGPCRTR